VGVVGEEFVMKGNGEGGIGETVMGRNGEGGNTERRPCRCEFIRTREPVIRINLLLS
jgi:hypothetical protein